MCGLSGAAGDLSFNHEKTVKTLLVFSTLRGSDATGLGAVTANGLMSIAKETDTFPFLFGTKRFESLFHGFHQVYIGHNRSKTVGENTRTNAHPFLFDDVLGAHNGTLDYQNKNRMEKGSEFKTDSEAIFNNIQVHGIEDTINKIDDSEAYALTWYDARNHTINFIRNEKRSLVMCFTDKHKVMFWASEYYILRAALAGQNIDIDNNQVNLINPDTHYCYQLPAKNTAFADPIRTKLEGRKSSWKQNTNNLFNKNNKKKEERKTGQTTIINSKTHNSTMTTSVSGGSSETGTDEEELVYGGLYIGMIPKSQMTTDTAKQVLEKATNSLKELDTDKDVLIRKKIEPVNLKSLTADDFTRKRAWEDALKADLVVPVDEKFPVIFAGPNLTVHYDTVGKQFVSLRYDNKSCVWDRFYTQEIPKDLPFTILNVDSNHVFRHVGRKKNKRIFYKGFNGKNLDRDAFQMHAFSGCVNCDRTPEWGHTVTFLNPAHDFLCEHCSRIPGVKEAMLALWKEEEVNKKVA